ncbi:zinc ribbon domain-containing protein [Actinoplanes hulinensis]|uniref:Zinc ribbon domain-containing protein n=1 Tax=Actinoplanes hulinensis TaxID=1144547 RepID=A0ABS7AUU7_9ACTN|nr:zinc ribbon domain-containing protein [Actinoplanes hulinensis]MBW6432394.1 zinc ribbon domain-containing protein [Actinoplanes hulinensis]
MVVTAACPHCRTALLPGFDECLRCGHPVDAPVQACTECAHLNTVVARFCSHCGHRLGTSAAPPESPGDPAAAAAAAANEIFVSTTSRTPRPLIVAAVVLGVLFLGVSAVKAVQSVFFDPANTVEAYFSALADRDAAEVMNTLVPGAAGEVSLLTSQVLGSSGYEPPIDVKVLESTMPEGGAAPSEDPYYDTPVEMATVRVEFRLGGERAEKIFYLRQDEATSAGIFQRWRIMNGVETLAVSAPGIDMVIVAGTTLTPDPEQGWIGLGAYPGTYRVGLAEHPLWSADEVVTRVGGQPAPEGGGEVVAVLQPTLKESARSVVDERIRAYLDGCAKSTTTSPPGCPFSSYSWQEVRNARWTIDEYPQHILVEEGGSLRVRTEEPGKASVTGTEVPSWSGQTSPYSDDVTFYLTGTVSAAGGQISFVPQ